MDDAHRLDVHAAATDAVLCLTTYLCDQACDIFLGGSSVINILPAKRALWLMMLSSFMGSIRYSVCYRVGIIRLIHQLCSRLSTQVGVALIGIQFFLLSFPNSLFSKYLNDSFYSEEYWSGIEKSLFAIVIFSSILHIRHVDRAVPYIIGIVPIFIAILCNGINIFITGMLAMIISTFALYQQRGGIMILGIRGILWFHILSALSVYLHTVTAINLAKGGIISPFDSLLFQFPTNNINNIDIINDNNNQNIHVDYNSYNNNNIDNIDNIDHEINSNNNNNKNNNNQNHNKASNDKKDNLGNSNRNNHRTDTLMDMNGNDIEMNHINDNKNDT